VTHSVMLEDAAYNLEKKIELSRRLAELATSRKDPDTLVWALFHLFDSCLLKGDSRGSGEYADALAGLVPSLHDRELVSLVYGSNASLAAMTGNWREARDFSHRELAIKLPPTSWFHYVRLLVRAHLEYQAGEKSDGDRWLSAFSEALRRAPHEAVRYSTITSAAYHISHILLFAKPTMTLEACESMAAECLASSPHLKPKAIHQATIGLGLCAALRGDAKGAAEQYEILLSSTSSEVFKTNTARELGLMARVAGRIDAAVDHFEESLRFTRRAGYRPECAWTCHDYAGTLLERDDPGDREKAKSLLEEGTRIAAEVGMPPLAEKIAVLREQLEPGRSRRQVYPDDLTDREAEVLRLLAAGLPNRRIGEELSISTHTVATHIRHIYEKTGAANRAEATGYALRNGISRG